VRQCRPRNEWEKEIKTGPYLLSVSPSLFFLPKKDKKKKKKKKKKWFQASPGPPSPPLSQLLSLPRFDAAGVI
jgi:hypothetical protein